MTLKQDLLKCIPAHIQQGDPDCKALFDLIKRQKLNTKEELIAFLRKETNMIEDWLKKNRSSGQTMVKLLRDKVEHLGCLRNCRKIVDRFLS